MIRRRSRPRRGTILDPEYLAWVRTQPSLVPTHDEKCLWRGLCSVSVHHVRSFGSPRSDHLVVPLFLCRHTYAWGTQTVEHGKSAFETRFGVNLADEAVKLRRKFETEVLHA